MILFEVETEKRLGQDQQNHVEKVLLVLVSTVF
jgi:hypothetical protein